MLHVSVESSVYLTDMWYLVIYEDDGNWRVLAEDEIRPIFPDEDEDEEVQIGDIVSALWIPNGKYYDAKVVQIGADRNVLMKERMRLEKAKKNEGKETGKEAPKVQQKRKNLESPGDGQKKKKTGSQVRSTKGSEQKEKEKEEKKKKKEEEQTRQKFLLEARKAQAALRWTPSRPNQEEGVEIVSPQNGIFRPEPLRRTSESSTTNRLTPSEPDVTVASPQFAVSTSDPIHRSSPSSACLTPPAHETVPARINTGNAVCTLESVHRTSPPSTTRPTPARINAVTGNAFCTPEPVQQSRPPSTTRPTPPAHETPARNSAGGPNHISSEPRRGLHFQSAIGDSSGDEADDNEEDDAPSVSSNRCCREQLLEIKALRKRLEKAHRRLNIACECYTLDLV